MSQTNEKFASINNALCKFHWQNTFPIDLQRVLLIPSYSKEPIELTKDVSLELTQFYSKELQVPCGAHSGYLLLDNKKYDLEDIQVKNYMFEIDLYIKDDVTDKDQKSEIINHERNLNNQQRKTDKKWDEEGALGSPIPSSKPETLSQTAMTNSAQNSYKQDDHVNSSSVLDIDQSKHLDDEVLPILSNSSCVVADVLGSKIDDTDSSVKQTNDKTVNSYQKGSNCSFDIPAGPESIDSREVTLQASRSTDSTSISSCQSLLKDQNFENQLPFCHSLSSSLCHDIPLPLSLSSVSHTSSVDSALICSQNSDQTLTPLQIHSGNSQTVDSNVPEKPKFNELLPEERASSAMSLPARFSPSLQLRDFQAGHSISSTLASGSFNTPTVDANQMPYSENPSLENKFGGSQPILRSPLITNRSRALRHSTPTMSQAIKLQDSGTPIAAKGYPPIKHFQTVETNGVPASGNLPSDIADYVDGNQHLTGNLELLRGMNESFLAELIFLRQLHNNYPTASQSAQHSISGTAQDSKDNLVSHLKEEKQLLQDEVQKLKEELRQYRHLAAYSQNTPLQTESSVLNSSQEKGNLNHNEELVLRRRIADLQHQVSQLLESNLNLSAQLVRAQTKISQFESDNHKLLEQIKNKEKDVDQKILHKKPVQPVEEEDNVDANNTTSVGNAHSLTDTELKIEPIGSSSVKDRCSKTTEYSRKLNKNRQTNTNYETTKRPEQDETISAAVNFFQNSHPRAEELQFENKVHSISKKSRKSVTESKASSVFQNGLSRNQAASDSDDKPQTAMELVNTSTVSNANEFLPSRKTRWDQYNQIRLNKASIQNLQSSLDEQDLLRQAFLAQYKPKACESSRTVADGWASYPRAKSKDRTGPKSPKSTIIPSVTSDSTSMLLAAPCISQTWEQRQGYSTDQDLTGEEYSDAGTEVLLRAGSFDKNSISPAVQRKDGWSHRRRMSIDSAGSSALTNSDFEMSGSSSNLAFMKKRSQSAEFQGNAFSDRLTGKPINREALKTINDTRYLDFPSTVSDVDDVDQPKKTAHISSNKKIISGSEAGKRQWLFTKGMQPYIPRSSDDMHIGDVVKFSKQSGKISQGVVKFIGPLYGRRDIYIGIELQNEEGKHDGVFEGRRYFRSKPNKGVFVTFNKIVMAWEPSRQLIS